MARAFRIGPDGHVHAEFDERERSLLLVLARQLSDIIGEPSPAPSAGDEFDAIISAFGQPVHRPAGDAVHARLFPRAHLEDGDIADEFDRAVLAQLRDTRARRTAEFAATLESARTTVALTPQQAHIWLAVLTDMRLMLGTNVAIEEDDPRRDDPARDPQASVYISVCDWLGWVQESLVACFL